MRYNSARTRSFRVCGTIDSQIVPRPPIHQAPTRGKGYAMTEKKYDIGLMGLAVMGQNLVLNMVDHGFDVAVFNRTTSKVDDFLATPEAQSKGDKLTGAHSLAELVGKLKSPRKIMLMIKSKDAVPAPELELYPAAAAVQRRSDGQ